jgi:hypothetical protein
MQKRSKLHRINCDWCNKEFWSDEPFVVTGSKLVFELKCNEQFVKNGYKLRREKTQENTE